MTVTPISLILALSLVGELPGPDGLLAPGASLEKLWDEGSFTEGGALAGDGAVLFSDIGDRIMRFDPKTKAVTVFREPSGRANGLIFGPGGTLFAAEGSNTGGGRRVSLTGPDGVVRTLADRYQGKRFNSPNDLAVDRRSRVYVSDPRYVGGEPRELDFEGVFRVELDGRVERLETTARKPNGLAISPDGATLYVADSGPTRQALLALDLDDAGRVSNPRVLHDFGKTRGVDGLTVAADGRVVAAAGSGPTAGVYVFTPSGKLTGVIPVPEPPTNVEFGGDDRTALYVTAGKSLYRVATTLTGFHVWPPR
ncbi:MAG: SMP-30/gluconolactonase/LRE family protein [Planctomycetia bacterium]|nr:SMP-30/gluconolactonase/LRE family protein [Planctomycetia bacterium]